MACKEYEYPLLHHSAACVGDGIGCDGWCDEHQDACNCMCHSLNAPDFLTNEDVKEWHK